MAPPQTVPRSLDGRPVTSLPDAKGAISRVSDRRDAPRTTPRLCARDAGPRAIDPIWTQPRARSACGRSPGEVQTPLIGPAADRLRLGDRVYFRHTKAGELCARFDRLYLVSGDRIADEVPTCRGEGKTFL